MTALNRMSHKFPIIIVYLNNFDLILLLFISFTFHFFLLMLKMCLEEPSVKVRTTCMFKAHRFSKTMFHCKTSKVNNEIKVMFLTLAGTILNFTFHLFIPSTKT